MSESHRGGAATGVSRLSQMLAKKRIVPPKARVSATTSGTLIHHAAQLIEWPQRQAMYQAPRTRAQVAVAWNRVSRQRLAGTGGAGRRSSKAAKYHDDAAGAGALGAVSAPGAGSLAGEVAGSIGVLAEGRPARVDDAEQEGLVIGGRRDVGVDGGERAGRDVHGDAAPVAGRAGAAARDPEF